MELPDDVLAYILRRVHRPEHLAACRRVCKDWRTAIDGHGLVTPHLLPSALCGVFTNYTAMDGWSDTGFFARTPWKDHGSIDTRLAFAPPTYCAVIDHCNGLLLCASSDDTHFVYNPATWRSAPLPPPPRYSEESSILKRGIGAAMYLVFDPAASLHYEVFLLADLPGRPHPPAPTRPSPPPFNVGRLFVADDDSLPEVDTDDDGEDWLVDLDEDKAPWHYSNAYGEYVEVRDTMELIEWPPPVYVVQVFSSATGRWEERTFRREGDAAGTVADRRVLRFIITTHQKR